MLNRSCLSLASLLALGCAPVGMLRPPGTLAEGQRFETGAGVAELGPRPYVTESLHYTGQAWFTADAARWLSLSGIAAFDTSAAAFGAAARWNALRNQRFTLAPEVEAGYAWLASSLGFSVRVFERNFVYTAPRFGTLGSRWGLGVPAGVSVDLTHGFVLRAEAQLSWQELKYYNRRLHVAGGIAYQF
jgi:hypothetical protein